MNNNINYNKHKRLVTQATATNLEQLLFMCFASGSLKTNIHFENRLLKSNSCIYQKSNIYIYIYMITYKEKKRLRATWTITLQSENSPDDYH